MLTKVIDATPGKIASAEPPQQSRPMSNVTDFPAPEVWDAVDDRRETRGL